MPGYWLSLGDVHSGNRASKLCVSWMYAGRRASIRKGDADSRVRACLRTCMSVRVQSRKRGRHHVLRPEGLWCSFGVRFETATVPTVPLPPPCRLVSARFSTGRPISPTPCMIESAYWNWILAAATAASSCDGSNRNGCRPGSGRCSRESNFR